MVPSLKEVLRQNKIQRAALNQGMSAVSGTLEPSSVSTSTMGTVGVSVSPPVTLGMNVWNEVFKGESFALPEVSTIVTL